MAQCPPLRPKHPPPTHTSTSTSTSTSRPLPNHPPRPVRSTRQKGKKKLDTKVTKKAKGHAPSHQNGFAFQHNPNSKLTKKILAMPNEGLCRRCTEKIEWRKKYRKYKPLRVPGSCNYCRKKAVTAAYHVACRPCAQEKAICAWCCKTWKALEKADAAAAAGESGAGGGGEMEQSGGVAAMDEEDEEEEEEEEAEEFECEYGCGFVSTDFDTVSAHEARRCMQPAARAARAAAKAQAAEEAAREAAVAAGGAAEASSGAPSMGTTAQFGLFEKES